jgi:hypothetical protein
MIEIGSKFDEHKTFIEIDRFPDVAHALLTKGAIRR